MDKKKGVKNMRLFLNTKAAILIILFLIALIPRIYHLDQTTIYPDEISWTVRGKELIFALKQGNFKYFDSVWWKSTKENEAIALPVTFLSGLSTILFGENQSKISLNLFSSITAARIPIAILNAFLIPIFYLLASHFVSKKAAFCSALLLAFDPIHLSLSRWVMLDGFLTLFMLSSIYFFILALKNWEWTVLAGLSLTLAFLTKPLGILPLVAWGFFPLTNKLVSIKNNLQILIIAILGFFVFTWIFWPGSWNKPILSIFEYLWQQKSLGQGGYSVFFLGQVTTHPSFYYYIFQIFTKIPFIILFLFLVSIILIIQKVHDENWKNFLTTHFLSIGLAIFFVFFFLVISLTPLKLGVRYALPLWPGIYLLVAWVINKIFKTYGNRSIKFLFVAILTLSGLWTLFSYFPNYYLFYNNLIGGPRGGQKYDMVGHCLGTRKALEYIQKNYPEINSVAVLGCSNVTAPYYFNGKITTDWQKEKIVIIENTFNQLSPEREETKYFKLVRPIFEAQEHGATLSRVYLQNFD